MKKIGYAYIYISAHLSLCMILKWNGDTNLSERSSNTRLNLAVMPIVVFTLEYWI
jgi:hypothetical protein